MVTMLLCRGYSVKDWQATLVTVSIPYTVMEMKLPWNNLQIAQNLFRPH